LQARSPWPFGIVVRRRLQFQEENPIANLEIELHGIVITVNVVALFASTQRDFRNKIAEMLLDPTSQHAWEGQIAPRTAIDAIGLC